jgi:mannose-6-phosphate isomerase
VVQHYAWGDPEFLPRLLGIEPDGRPWAEYWLGTHPSGASVLAGGSPIADLTGELPYLLKVIAAAEPLSLQAHPDAEQARNGFGRGVYADQNSKPELLCALTPFEALCGIRPGPATAALFDELGIEDLARVLAAEGPAAALAALYGGSVATEPIIAACQRSDRREAEWVRKLAVRYPGDPGVAVTLLLNHVVLAPGQAIRLDAGNLHSYLHGAGIELMGPSDNVARGGLTAKPVDVAELLRIVDATPLEQPVLADAKRHELPGAGVALQRLDPGDHHVAAGHELAIDLNGRSWYFSPGDRVDVEVATFVVTSA